MTNQELSPKTMSLDKIQFAINGKTYIVGPEVPPTLTLVEFIRQWANLSGTKALCYEGGCGICIVVATRYEYENNAMHTFSINACQTLLYSCMGWSIETIEHIGNKYDGYSSMQKAISEFYGTQCGFCTPGFIMAVHGMQKAGGPLTAEKIEKSLDGNLCRCTGYRPILDAFKSIAFDASPKLNSQYRDIEDYHIPNCPKTVKNNGRLMCTGKVCAAYYKDFRLNPSFPVREGMIINFGNIRWYRPVSLDGLYKILKNTVDTDCIRFVVGNTGQGVYKNDGPFNIYIDTSGVRDLYAIGMGVPLIIGANITLERCIQLFHLSSPNPGLRHLEYIANHWDVIANISVRNVASWAGNLMLKKDHHEFTSDIFVTLCAMKVFITVGDPISETTKDIPVEEFLTTDIGKGLIISMLIPPNEDIFVRTYKITQRAVNSHAYINAAFRFKIDRNDNYMVLEKPDIFFGGVRPDFIRATATENFLDKKQLGLTQNVKSAMKRLLAELKPDRQPNDATPAYRISLCQSLLYKAILDLIGSSADAKYRSGGQILVRPPSSSKQSFDDNKESWPIGKGIPKLESYHQVSGEAVYLDDITYLPDELHGAFVQTTVAKATIESIDTTDAMKIPGVIDFITEKDIVGLNSVVRIPENYADPIFVFHTVSYAGQSVGLIVAKRRDIALEAVKLVKVTYKNIQKPILTIKEALKVEISAVSSPVKISSASDIVINNIEAAEVKKPAHVLKGGLDMGSQFHLTMEPYSALVIPIEDGYKIYSTTQWQSNTRAVLSQVMAIESHRIHIETKRLGGGYGGKATRANICACAASVAAQKLRVPVRVVLPLDVNMTLTGWREPFYSDYEVGIDSEGRFQYVNVTFVGDSGFISNESSGSSAAYKIPSVYYSNSWKFTPKVVVTDTAANTWCRTPGTTEAIATMENIIEHVSSFLNKEPSSIRELNFVTEQKKNRDGFGPTGENLAATKIFPQLKEQTMYDLKRADIETFNMKNRWKKRGLAIMPMLYKYNYPSFRYSVHVAIYENDGSVAISHGGIEMGQGVNTKVAQVAAKILGIPLKYIAINPTDGFVSANSSVSGGSYTSDLCVHGASKSCEKLKTRMDVIREKMKIDIKVDPTWPALVEQCFNENVDLSERYWTSPEEHPVGYDIYGGAVVEVEIDVLTGQFLIHRTDIIEDCGKSLNPYIDVGQVEGSIIMGFGFYTSEIVKYNPKTGEKISNGTWEYKVPTAFDIPVDFRVSFLAGGTNPYGVVGSKEPAVCLSYCLVSALRHAITSARAEAGVTGWFTMDLPMTVERIQRLCKVHPDQFNLRKTAIDVEKAF